MLYWSRYTVPHAPVWEAEDGPFSPRAVTRVLSEGDLSGYV